MPRAALITSVRAWHNGGRNSLFLSLDQPHPSHIVTSPACGLPEPTTLQRWALPGLGHQSLGTYLLEIVKCSKDDVMPPSDQAYSSQQLQDKCFGSVGKAQGLTRASPSNSEGGRVGGGGGEGTGTVGAHTWGSYYSGSR